MAAGGGTVSDNWAAEAACRNADQELFFPISETSDLGHIAEAKAICATCPVRATCRERKLAEEGGRDWRNRYGIWGGLTPSERATVARRRTRQAAA